MDKDGSDKGCLLTGLALVAGFAAIEVGVVVIAVALHLILGAEGYHPLAMAAAIGGVLLIFGGPQLAFLAGSGGPRVTAAQAVAAIPDFALSAWFVLGWAAPHIIGKQAAGMLPGLMVLEFAIIHASVALVAAPRAIAQKAGNGPWWMGERAVFAGLLLLYSLLAAGISAAYQTAWLFIAFWLLMANKFVGDWLAPAAQVEERRHGHIARWGVSAALYFLLAVTSIFIPVPELGAVSASRGDGHWEQHPEQAVAMGALYFALLGLCELYGGFNKVPAAELQTR